MSILYLQNTFKELCSLCLRFYILFKTFLFDNIFV